MPGDIDAKHGTPAAAGRTPLRALGAVALVATVGTVAVGRLIRHRWLAAQERRAEAALRRLTLARREFERRVEHVEHLVADHVTPAPVADRAVRDLDNARTLITDLIRRGEDARRLFDTPTQNTAA